MVLADYRIGQGGKMTQRIPIRSQDSGAAEPDLARIKLSSDGPGWQGGKQVEATGTRA